MPNTYDKEDKLILAVDCIIFGFDGDKLKVLLIKRSFAPQLGRWSLIGGFLKKKESLDSAASRILNKLTGVHQIYMEQFYTFSKIDRDPVERTVSVAYFALINIENHNKELIENYNAQWFDLSKMPNLIFDHNEMLIRAVSRLRRRVASKPIGFDLLPKKFTMLQLQKLYESILDKTLDKRNFINKIRALEILDKLSEKDMSSSAKGSYLYKFDEDKYKEKSKKDFALKL